MDIGIARLSLNQSSDHSGHVKSSDLVFSDMNLLTLILVHLPSKKLMQFKCVSKSWLSLIKTPYFKLQRSMLTVPPSSGFFVQRPFTFTSSDPVFYFPLRDEYNDSGMIRNLPTFCNHLFNSCGAVLCRCPDSRSIRILDSSHGLLLCSDYFLGVFRKSGRDHYVYNPTTNQLATLPRTTDHRSFLYSLSMTLAFRPSNSPHYKVLACATMSQSESPIRIRQFEIYSSETKSWRVSGQPFPEPYGIEFMGGVYCNGSVYWIDKLKPGPSSADWLFFNLNEERLKKFPNPPIRLTSISRGRSYFGESDDHLHFIEVDLHATSLLVYELKCDHSGWYVRYQVDLAQLSKAYSQMINDLHDEKYYKVVVLSLVRRDEFVEDDSFLVLKMPGKVIRYNLVNRNLEEIFEHKEVIDQSNPLGGKIWQYVECRSSV